MSDHRLFDLAALVAEIMRYLATVDLFRSEGCEPTWRPEMPDGVAHTSSHGQAAIPAAH